MLSHLLNLLVSASRVPSIHHILPGLGQTLLLGLDFDLNLASLALFLMRLDDASREFGLRVPHYLPSVVDTTQTFMVAERRVNPHSIRQ